MVNIVFIGNKNNRRIEILKNIPNSNLHIIKDYSKIPPIVIDLFVIERTEENLNCSSCFLCQTLKINNKLKHIPVISLTKTEYLDIVKENSCDLLVSNIISDIEFENYVKTMIKMKLMDDELKKEKIVLELKVKERTLELQKQADKLNITMNSMGDGVIVTDAKGIIISINPAVKTSCSISEEECIGKHINKIFKFYINNEYIDIFKIVKKTNKIYKLPIDSVLKTKRTKLRISDSASPIFDKDGNFNGLVLVYHDVTEEYEMRKNLIESERKYKRLYDNIPDIIYTVNMEGIFTSINEAVNQFGYKKEEVIGKSISIFVYDEDLKIILEQLENKKNGIETISKYNVIFKCKDGTNKILEVKSHLIKTLNEKNNEIFVIARDVTNIIKVQNELRIAKENAEKSDNLKSILISNLTHEIKTPLNAIMGFSSLISEKVHTKDLKNFSDMIIHSGKKLSELISKIIDISEISSGSLKLFKKHFSMNELLKEIQCEILNELNERNKNNNINLLLIENQNDILFYGDRRRINEIIYELILNSIKFTNNGTIKYGYEYNDNEIIFYIHDTGVGIDEKNIELVFNSFYQINRHKQKIQEGVGLGLTFCKELITLFKGDIKIESIYGIGTTVSFKLPIEEEKEEDINFNISTQIPKISKKVLSIVENRDTDGLLQLVLLSELFEVERSNTFSDSINMIKNNNYDLIIIDVNNLSFNGFDLIDWINTNNIKTPYIISSNIKDEKEKNVIDNPINTSQLLETIKKILG